MPALPSPSGSFCSGSRTKMPWLPSNTRLETSIQAWFHLQLWCKIFPNAAGNGQFLLFFQLVYRGFLHTASNSISTMWEKLRQHDDSFVSPTLQMPSNIALKWAQAVHRAARPRRFSRFSGLCITSLKLKILLLLLGVMVMIHKWIPTPVPLVLEVSAVLLPFDPFRFALFLQWASAVYTRSKH